MWARKFLYAAGTMETLKMRHGNAACQMLEYYQATADAKNAAKECQFHHPRSLPQDR